MVSKRALKTEEGPAWQRIWRWETLGVQLGPRMGVGAGQGRKGLNVG